MTKSSLKELRKENGKSRAEVAAALSVSIQTIYKYEQGVRHISLEQVLILEDLYNCTSANFTVKKRQGTRLMFTMKKGTYIKFWV